MQTKEIDTGDSDTWRTRLHESVAEALKGVKDTSKTVEGTPGIAKVAEPSETKTVTEPVKSEAPLSKSKGETPTKRKTAEKSTGSFSLSRAPSGKTKTKALRAEKFWKSKLTTLHNSKLSAGVIAQCSALADQSGASVSYFVAGALLQSANREPALKESASEDDNLGKI